MAWINLIAPKAMDVAKGMVLSPDAKALLASNPGGSAGEFAKALASQKLNTDAVGFLSRGMKPRAGVAWASESAAKVAPKLPPAEVRAAELAKAWTKGQASPAALRSQLAQTPLKGPGSWSARAALFASEPPIPAGGAMTMPALPGGPTPLTSSSVEGAVKLAAAVDTDALQLVAPAAEGMPSLALPEPIVATPPDMPAMQLPSQLSPPQLQAINDALAPFVDMGLEIAQGQMPGMPAMPGMPGMPGLPGMPVA